MKQGGQVWGPQCIFIPSCTRTPLPSPDNRDVIDPGLDTHGKVVLRHLVNVALFISEAKT